MFLWLSWKEKASQFGAGLKVNWQKTTLVGVNIPNEEVVSNASRWGCRTGSLPFDYLGLPLGGNHKTMEFWAPVIDRIGRRLDKWKNALFSKGGRLTLIESALSNLPTYFMSMFPMPSKVIKLLEQKFRNFLWAQKGTDSGSHLVNWNRVTLQKARGGLGIGRLKERNQALISKWCWRFSVESDSLWYSIISSIHGLDTFGWFTNPRTRITGSSPWNFVKNCRLKIGEVLGFKLGDGSRIKFWHDWWIGNISLKRRFPRLFNLACNKQAVVRDYWTVNTEVWSLILKRPLYDREIDDFISLLQLLEPHRITHLADSLCWSLDKNGFSIASLFAYLTDNEGVLDEKLADCIWAKGCPKKVNFFTWNLMVGGINTANMIQRRNPKLALSPSCCYLCYSASENENHLFFGCPFAAVLWNNLLHIFGVSWCFGKCLKANLYSLLIGHPFKKKARWIWEKAVKLITWEIWLERNRRIFHNKISPPNDIWDLTRYKVSLFASMSKFFCNYSVLLINANWNCFM